MRYKVGQEVVLKNSHDVFGSTNVVEIVRVDFIPVRYWSEQAVQGVFDDKDIDHEKTAELTKDKTLNHYQGELEKVVAEKNKQVDRVEDDSIKPDHYKKTGKDLIEIWKDIFDEKEFRAVMKSNILRYTIRYENKNGIEDLKKADEFNRRLREWEEEIKK